MTMLKLADAGYVRADRVVAFYPVSTPEGPIIEVSCDHAGTPLVIKVPCSSQFDQARLMEEFADNISAFGPNA